jgi:hypothetical protein
VGGVPAGDHGDDAAVPASTTISPEALMRAGVIGLLRAIERYSATSR